ncbi:hypothetical protein I4U23_013492 [Adineta vaga]|nr:hypothetical protein I4U23_013492 [Adineta vaga]
MPYKSMENISQEKTGFDAYRVFTNNIATLQSYPYVHQSDQGYNTDRSKSNKTFHYSRGYGGVLLCDEYDSQSEMLFSNQNYTSYQQTTNNQCTRDSKAPTYEPYTSDPFLKSHSCTSFYDTRSPDIINWDRTQRRNLEYYRKPLDNVPSAFRTRQHTSNYTDASDTYKMQNLNPVLRSKEPKYATHLPKTRNSRWIKTNPIPDDDQSDDTYITTTADVYKILPIDYSSPRHTNIHGIFSKSISNIMPYNPYHPAHYCSETVNGSLDSRPHLILQQLPRIKLPPKPVIHNNPKPASTIENETGKPKA